MSTQRHSSGHFLDSLAPVTYSILPLSLPFHVEPLPYNFGPLLLNHAELNQSTVIYSLYAPAADRVELILYGDGYPDIHCCEVYPMHRLADGWFGVEVQDAKAGSLYHFQINGHHRVPDPASRYQPFGVPGQVSGPSQVIDPNAFTWADTPWLGRPWEESIIYELHIGTFTPEGTYAGAEKKLDYLVDLGITAIELMPIATFAGQRNWGYDGVYPYAPAPCYGHPDELKQFIQAAHQKGLMVFLDVVYNHFGPEGNYLHLYAPNFFTERHQSPWGAGINLDGEDSAPVRSFFIQNALYWVEEFRLDGLRLDAIHTIHDDSPVPMLQELAERLQRGPGQHRHIHLMLENEYNGASWLTGHPADKTDTAPGALSRACYTAQWDDDLHHTLHVLATGQTDSYYVDYAEKPVTHLIRALTDGFAFQGEASTLRHGKHRGEPSCHLPATAFISFYQNHDQVGNHPFGSRASLLVDEPSLQATMTVLLLLPHIPMLFMGEEWQTQKPFPFFCDFHDELATQVREGRRQEFAHNPAFNDPQEQQRIPDPNSKTTFTSAILDWQEVEQPEHRHWRLFYQQLLSARHQVIIPMLKIGLASVKPTVYFQTNQALGITWLHTRRLWLLANWAEAQLPVAFPANATVLAESRPGLLNQVMRGVLPAKAAIWLVSDRLEADEKRPL
jgi:maltooligosyltrehalose trehalohydrolase